MQAVQVLVQYMCQVGFCVHVHFFKALARNLNFHGSTMSSIMNNYVLACSVNKVSNCLLPLFHLFDELLRSAILELNVGGVIFQTCI